VAGGVAANISQPGGAEISDQLAQALRLRASGNFGSGYAGLGSMQVPEFYRNDELGVLDRRAGGISGLAE